jgi:RNA polymerase sigma-70 factor (ECF subfamily)
LPKKLLLFKQKNISKLSDEELLALYNSSGKTAYFGELYNRYIPLLYGVCLKYLHDADKAHDAVMHLFENLLPKISNYQIAVFRTWIYSVSKNHCLQILRKENKEIPVDFGAKSMESYEVLHLLSEDEEDSERMEALKNCMEKLPEAQRISITHFFMDEMSYADIAESTGYTLSRVKSYIQNGKRNLKICIEKQTE